MLNPLQVYEMGDGPTVYGWAVEYAKSGKSKCQLTNELIPQGDLRIGKEVDSSFKVGQKMTVWHMVEPLFASFKKGSSKKSRLSDVSELVGFDSLKKPDQKKIRDLIDARNAEQAEMVVAEAGATYLEAVGSDGEKKWWSIVVVDNKTRVRWGKVGEEDNNLSEKEHKDGAAATKFEQKMLGDKTKKGYAVVDKTPAAVHESAGKNGTQAFLWTCAHTRA